MSKAGYPRIIQRSVTVGAGPFQLLPSRETSFGLFRDRLVDGDVVGVVIVNPGTNDWQECLCTFNLGSPDTLTVLAVIASSAVADAAVTFTGGSKLVMLSSASYTLWAAEKLRPPVRCAVKTNQVLATITAGSTLDGLTMVAGNRFALLGQTVATEIGLYKIPASGAPTRCKDFSLGDTVSCAIVPIGEGTYAGSYAFCTSVAGSDIVGTSSLTWSLSGPGVWQPLDATLTALAGANWAANAIPIGTGADTVAQTTFAANTFPARASTGNLVAKPITDYGLGLVNSADAPTARTTLGLGTVATLASDTDGTLATNSDLRVPTQKAVKTYVDTAVTGVLHFKGSQDCSANPNYPVAVKGDAYIVSVAGKIGGAAGKSVDVGDVYAASADNGGGNEATVGTSWFVLEHNLVGALLAANNLSDVANAATAVNNLGGATSTGTGGLVRTTSPTLVTPSLGVATATSVNKVAITQPASGSTLTVADGKTLTASNTLTLAGTDGSTLNVGTGGTLGALALKASVDLSTVDATGVLAAGRFPALTGDVTSSAGSLATTIAANAVTYAKFQQVAANSLVGNSGGSLANAAAVGLTSNLKMTSGNLDTVQGIQTSSRPQFASLGLGTPATSNNLIVGLNTATDVDFTTANLFQQSRVTVNSARAIVVNSTTLTKAVSSGVTDSGLTYGQLFQVLRNSDAGAASDNGTLALLAGQVLQVGHSNSLPAASPVTTACHGSYIAPQFQRGTIGTFRAMYLASAALLAAPSNWASATYTLGQMVKPTVGNGNYYVCTTAGTSGGLQPTWGTTVGGTTIDGGVTWTAIVIPSVTNYWGLYSEDAAAQNYIANTLQVGHTGTALGKIESRATSGAAFVASYDASNSMSQQVSSTGLCTWTGAGTSKGHVFTDGIQAGSGACRVKPGGTLKTIVTSTANVATTETDLHSSTIPANTLINDGDSLEVQMNFQVPNNANNKTIKFYVDGTQIMTSGAAAVAGQFAQIVATITRVNSVTTIISAQFIPETGSAWSRVDKQPSQNIDWTGSRVIKATGQSSAASNDIVQRSTTINYDPANP